jgi:hypothetical protein
MYRVLESLFLRVLNWQSREAAASEIRGIRFSRLCPLAVRRKIKFERIAAKSVGLFCVQYRRNSPWMRPLKQLGGWADSGGMYKYRLSGF